MGGLNGVDGNGNSTYRPGGITGKGFMPGVSGNPGGKQKHKPFYEEVMKQVSANPELVVASVRQLFKNISKGDMSALKMFVEMVDGPTLKAAIRDALEATGMVHLT